MKVDRGLEVVAVAEAAALSLDAHDFAIEALSHAVGDAVPAVAERGLWALGSTPSGLWGQLRTHDIFFSAAPGLAEAVGGISGKPQCTMYGVDPGCPPGCPRTELTPDAPAYLQLPARPRKLRGGLEANAAR